ncbi:iron chelate uptake ABC transporter family permease subunit [Microvirga tunisiensis]|uniref:Iron chelate uptake ABC transporter family permease subunit n=1 Tax=Pannonibacter tanglangensis TaxID=2750084 RepID=A0A7X5F4Z2_9HYPH|nr:iron chelate uptake ABC transporter family permease subunit [Pannonibacter sp. XCT-53]NBN79836.1 iron chelate uptake ABC transporter family permease subunit [Pannonibacter sp. XCT-53]
MDTAAPALLPPIVLAFIEALTFRAGYNAALVALGAALLGAAAGAAGTFLFLRKRTLVSDAIAHATLPGVGLAFILMVALGGSGRALPGLLIGSALSAGLGLLAVTAITRHTRLAEDTAIGAVLSVFFGFGIVLLTVIQVMESGRQAGLEGFLLGSTAGMLFQDAVLIAAGSAVCALLLLLFRRPLTLVCFDPGYAEASGVSTSRMDALMLGLVLAITVIGLKLVGLILIVALLVIPPVTARFWSERTGTVTGLAALFGALAGYLGAALSASAPNLPTGPIIVLVGVALFVVSLLVAPQRGVLASALAHRRFQHRVHLRQGLLSLAHGEPIHDRLTLKVLTSAGYLRRDRQPTEAGRAEAARALLDENRWRIARQLHPEEAVGGRYDGLTAIADVLTPDEIAVLDTHLGPRPVEA